MRRRLLRAALVLAEVALYLPAGLALGVASLGILTGRWHSRR